MTTVNPNSSTMQAMYRFYFANTPRIYNGIYYEPRLSKLPSLSLRVERRFGDPGQMGGGNVEIRNDDGYFDDLTALQWNAGSIVMKLGVDDIGFIIIPDLALPDGFYAEDGGGDGFITDDGVDGFSAPASASMTLGHSGCLYSEFDTVGTWKTKSWDVADDVFVLQFEEVKSATKQKIPTEFYTREEYAGMRESDVGKVKQVAYGKIYDVAPVCVDEINKVFQVAGHAIRGFFGFRIKSDTTGSWVNVNIPLADRDEANAQYTLTEWDLKAEVACDFFGKNNLDGTLMNNPSDVVEDILTEYLGIGSSELHTTSFSDSVTALSGQRALSVYVQEETEAFDVISGINAACGTYLFNDYDGKYRFVVYSQEVGSSLMAFTEDDIFSFKEDVDAKEIISMIKGGFAHRHAKDWSQTYFYERAQAQYLQGAKAPVLRNTEYPFADASDAQSAAQRDTLYDGKVLRTYQAVVSPKGWPLLPSDFIQLSYTRRGINGTFEVLEAKRNLNDGKVTLVLGDFREAGAGGGGSEGGTGGGQAGYWTEEDAANVFPATLSGETGYGDGSAHDWDASWSTALKSWARQNLGFWTDEYGFADPADPESYLPSIWI